MEIHGKASLLLVLMFREEAKFPSQDKSNNCLVRNLLKFQSPHGSSLPENDSISPNSAYHYAFEMSFWPIFDQMFRWEHKFTSEFASIDKQERARERATSKNLNIYWHVPSSVSIKLVALMKDSPPSDLSLEPFLQKWAIYIGKFSDDKTPYF